jgi:hypothetical protein
VVPKAAFHHHLVLEHQGFRVERPGFAGPLHEGLAGHLHAVRGPEDVEVDEVDGAVLAAEREGEGEQQQDRGAGGEVEIFFVFFFKVEEVSAR